jgi:exodeoxyribonuclease-1
VSSSIFWYDYETTGINPRSDRPLQVAGIRTDFDLNEIAAPLNLYCQPSDDILPHPMACLITGITPQRLFSEGICEAEFMTRVHAELVAPGTCGAGYNTLRFDDEMTRHSLYRNFFDPYGREWQGGNSRWDLIDVLRAAYALRPEGIEWPQVQGRVSFKLELLTAANGLEHGQAHDALSDVRATIAMARLLRERQPRLYQWLFELRSKHSVLQQVRLLEPLVHIFGRFSAARHYLGVVLPLAWHPHNRNALIVCDLHTDPAALWQESPEALKARLYRRREELQEGQAAVPLKLIHVNRCPVVAPLSVLRGDNIQRLQLDLPLYEARAALLRRHQDAWRERLAVIYEQDSFEPAQDPEHQLYDGFIKDRDRRLCEQVRGAEPHTLGAKYWMFDDPRLPRLLKRYRARNFPETLSAAEQLAWQTFCRERLLGIRAGAPHTLAEFDTAMVDAMAQASGAQQSVLQQWQAYTRQLQSKLAM